MEGKKIGNVFNFFEYIGVAAIELSDNLKLGDTLRFVGEGADFTEIVDSIQIDGKNVMEAKAGDKVGLKVSDICKKGCKVYRVK